MEIERKFQVTTDDLSFLDQAVAVHKITQVYMETGDKESRIRICGDKATFTRKTGGHALSREEVECEIEMRSALDIINVYASESLVEKTRYVIEHDGMTWEVDVFHGANEGLVMAEVELTHEGQDIALPEWGLSEVTGRPEFYNQNIAKLVKND